MFSKKKKAAESEYRVWDGKEMIYSSDGGLFEFSGKDFFFYSLDKTLLASSESGGHIMKFTGFKDKNKNKIFEGDIISKQGAFVLFDEDFGAFCFQFKGSKTPPEFLFREVDKAKVIGNIFENPKLY